MGVIKDKKARSRNADNWDLCHRIINTVRQASGMVLSTRENPYLMTPAKKEKSEEKSMVL